MRFHVIITRCFDRLAAMIPMVRAFLFLVTHGVRFKRLGSHFKIRGIEGMNIGHRVGVGDFCWIQAVLSYGGIRYSPSLSIGDDVAISDLTHISCAYQISIGAGCLLGSKIYIGDHYHGSTRTFDLLQAPAHRPLANFESIQIGDRVWVGDGAVILPGARIASGSIIGANSVVGLSVDRPALIAGIPARVVRYLDQEAD